MADATPAADEKAYEDRARVTDGGTTPEPGAERAVTIVRQFFRGEYEAVAGKMGPELRAELPPDRLAALWENNLSRQLGEFEGIDDVTYDEGSEEATVYVASTGESVQAEIQFGADGAVVGFLITQAHGEPGDDDEYAPPAYADDDAFTERELAVPTEVGDLGGTLTRPTGDGPHPGVVLVHGSGPNDRDASNGPNRPFQDLAWGLATEGVASLRYDKRSYASGWEIEHGVTPDDETVRDAVAAVETLGSVEAVDETVVVGHSLGASLAPRIAQRTDVTGIVCLAGTPRHPVELIVDQTEYLATVDGRYTDADRAEFDEITAAAERIRADDVEAGEWLIDHPASYWRFWNEYDPGATLRSSSVPATVVHLGRDVQVTTADLTAWRRLVGDCGHVDVERYPWLNHLAIPTAGKRTPAEYAEHGNVAAELIVDLAGWVRQSDA